MNNCRKRIASIFLLALLLSSVSIHASAEFDIWNGLHGPVTQEELLGALKRHRFLYGDHFTITHDVVKGQMRIIDTDTNEYVVNFMGVYPYVQAEGDVPAEVPDPSTESANRWVTYDSFPPKTVQLVVLSKDNLSETVQALNDQGITCSLTASGDYYVITKTEGRKTYFYCNSSGCPYVASKSPAAADQNFNYIVDNSDHSTDNSITVDTSIIDIGDKTMNVINDNGEKVEYNIDSLYFDASTSTYTANTYQYDITNNTYNYYTWNITYNISNTYINYIGSNAAYQQEEYEYYYELPDGRSSADLTADEIAGMSFQFADVVNYARSATDTSLRTLYHFDGNTEDSGYFSTQTAFTWTSGASITYMDSSSFNGALYLDETAHAFNLTLPSNLGSGDFSLQFRHYQASQPDTLSNIENSLSIGGTKVLRWDERNFYFSASGSTATCTVPIGSWAEIALIRNNGTLYFYINGLKIASKTDSTAYQGKLSFAFGSTSRAYTMLDELRVVNFAVAKSGASYTCTTVPYDTNLVLVLPDGAFPIADEYWEFNNPTAKFSGDFTQGIAPAGWSLGSLSTSSSVRYLDGYTAFQVRSTDSWPSYRDDVTQAGLSYRLSKGKLSTTPTTYYFSYIDTSGEVHSTSFKLYIDGSTFNFNGSQVWGNGNLYQSDFCRIRIDCGDDAYFAIGFGYPFAGDIVYAELATSPITDFEKVSCIYSSEEVKPNTAAVQSSVPVSGYTVGGVRPTFPARGDVWFPVEGRRVSGCYIYDGSMWRSAGARYYTGTRWIPIYAFDIITLEDCWDIADKDDATPPITSETGFWN